MHITLGPIHSLAAAAILAGCASPVTAVAPPAATLWKDTGTPPATIAQQREVRYYRDSSGATWDDRGKRVEPTPGAGVTATP